MHYKKNYSYEEYIYCYWFIGNYLICISKGVTRTREIRLVLAFTFYYNFFGITCTLFYMSIILTPAMDIPVVVELPSETVKLPNKKKEIEVW